MKNDFTIETIKSVLIRSCLENQPKSFIPYLMSEKVTVGMPNKLLFYKFFKMMVGCARKSSVGSLKLKMESPNWKKDKSAFYFNFYDEQHLHSRLSIALRESENQLYLETLPF